MYKGKFMKWRVRKNRKRKDSSGASTLSDTNDVTPPRIPGPGVSQTRQASSGPTNGTGAIQLHRSPTIRARYRIPQEVVQQALFGATASPDTNGHTPLSLPISGSSQ